MENEKKEDKFEFVTETIKKKPINKKREGTKILFTILYGILFGVVACAVFVLLAPKLYSYIYPEKTDPVSISNDVSEDNIPENEDLLQNEAEDEQLVIEKTPEEDSLTSGSEESPENIDNEDLQTVSENETESEESPVEEKEEETENKSTIINHHIIEKKSLTINDYEVLYREIGEVARDVFNSMVTVYEVSESTDWFMNSYDSGDSASGLILADNGKELLIVSNIDNLDSTNEIEVVFINGESVPAAIKKIDSDTNLAVIAVALDELSDGTKNSIKMARLGTSSLKTLSGAPVIALGAPNGINDSMVIGNITSNSHSIDISDTNVRYITTDIYGGSNGSGVLIDLDGKVLGIIFQGEINNENENLIHAYGISDLKGLLEKMSNGHAIAYLGIQGTDVTSRVSEELGVPLGAYVTRLTVDSPAMREGIQNGDVIVKMGTTDITSFSDYKDEVLKCQPGDIVNVTVKRLGKDEYVELTYEILLEEKP